MSELADRRVVVVGGSSGIGLAVAQSAAAAGAQVTVASSDHQRAAEAAAGIGGDVKSAKVDLRDERSVADFFARADAFDHIVSTAGDWPKGGLATGPIGNLDLDTADQIFQIRFWGAVLLAKHGSRKLNGGGSLVFTGGTIAHRPRKGTYLATAMAGGLEHLVRGLAVDLAPVRVNLVCPGLIRTRIWDRIPEESREAELTRRTEGYLIPRVGEVEEVASAYLHLMQASYTTGQVLRVEGGSLLGA